MSVENLNIIPTTSVQKLAAANVAMANTMHAALTEILHCEVSLDGGIAQRYIAENALIDVQRILINATKLEVQNAEI